MDTLNQGKPVIRLTTKLSDWFNRGHALRIVMATFEISEEEASRALPQNTGRHYNLEVLAAALEALGFDVRWL